MNDLEIYWEIAGGMAGAAKLVLTGCVLNWFVRPFLQEKRYAYLPGMVYSAVMLVLYVFPWYNGFRIVNIFGIAAFGAAMYAVDKRNVRQKVFLAVSCYLLKWITGGVETVLWSVLSGHLLLHPYLTDKPIMSLVVFCVLETVSFFTEFGIQFFACSVINRAYVSKREDMTGQELVLMLLPFSVILSGCFLFSYWAKIYERDLGSYIEDVHPAYQWFLLCYQVLSFAAMLAVIVIYQNIKKIQRKERENVVLSKEMETLQRHIGEVEALYNDIRGLKHDMGNHVMLLERLLAGGEQKEAEEYLSRMKAAGEMKDTGIKSGNPVTDVILTEKKREAEAKGILLTCDFHYPAETKINAFDISVILHNALDNAIEGAGHCAKPYVRICSHRRKNAYLIEVINSIAGEVVINEESGLPETTKGGSGEHGYGLANIGQVAARYFGGIDMVQTGEEFKLTVLLMLA